MDRLDELSTFLAIFEAGSLVGAAKRRRKSPPAVSRILTGLEDRLGARLFERTTRHLVATDAGRRLAGHARGVLEQYEELARDISGAVETPRGRLRVTAPVMFGRMHVAPLLLSFMDAYPHIELDLVLADHNLDLVYDEIDIAFRIGNLQESGFIARYLGEVRNIVVASPSYIDRHGCPKTPNDFTGHDLIYFSSRPQAPEWRFKVAEKEVAIQIAPRIVVNQADAAIFAACMGKGMTSVSSYQAIPDIEQGRLMRVLTEFERDPIPINLVMPSARHLPRRVRAFVDYCVLRYNSALEKHRESQTRQGNSDAGGVG